MIRVQQEAIVIQVIVVDIHVGNVNDLMDDQQIVVVTERITQHQVDQYHIVHQVGRMVL